MKKQAIVFDHKDDKEYVEGEQTMDLMLHFAQAGMNEAEQLMRDQPEMFSEEEIMDFAANKVVLAKAPDVLDDYKKKVKEFEQLHEKVQSVLTKCETVVEKYDERQIEKQAAKEVEERALAEKRSKDQETEMEARTIRYTKGGEMVINTETTRARRRRGPVNIELKKSADY